MASNFLVMRLRREPCGTYGLQKLAAGGHCSHGLFSPLKGCNYLVVYPYASCRPGREPARLRPSLLKATSISWPLLSPCPPHLCHLLAACRWLPAPLRGCRRWGAAGTVTLCYDQRSWPLMPLWRGSKVASPHSRSSQTSREPVGRCSVVTELPGLSWRLPPRSGHPHGCCPWVGGGCCGRGYLAPLWARSCVELLLHRYLLCGVSSVSPIQVF